MKRVARFSAPRIRLLERVVRQSESRGYGIGRDKIVPDVNPYGVAACDVGGLTFASINLVGSADAFPQSRLTQGIDTLQNEGCWIAGQQTIS